MKRLSRLVQTTVLLALRAGFLSIVVIKYGLVSGTGGASAADGREREIHLTTVDSGTERG